MFDEFVLKVSEPTSGRLGWSPHELTTNNIASEWGLGHGAEEEEEESKAISPSSAKIDAWIFDYRI